MTDTQFSSLSMPQSMKQYFNLTNVHVTARFCRPFCILGAPKISSEDPQTGKCEENHRNGGGGDFLHMPFLSNYHTYQNNQALNQQEQQHECLCSPPPPTLLPIHQKKKKKPCFCPIITLIRITRHSINKSNNMNVFIRPLNG